MGNEKFWHTTETICYMAFKDNKWKIDFTNVSQKCGSELV